MKNVIYYFSGTGNSLKVAKDISVGLGQTELKRIDADTDVNADLSSLDKIGFVFPVYMWGLPVMVNKFIEKINIPKDKYIFAVATYGGSPGTTIIQFNDVLMKKGLKLSLGRGIKMPGNYIPLYGAPKVEKQNKMFSVENSKVKEFVEELKKNETPKLEKSFFLFNLISSLIYKVSVPKIHKMDKSFSVDDNCNGCGICAKVCPSNNIAIFEDGKPVWRNNCEQCLACIHWCPEKAIQAGKGTKNRARYHHPDIKLEELVK